MGGRTWLALWMRLLRGSPRSEGGEDLACIRSPNNFPPVK